MFLCQIYLLQQCMCHRAREGRGSPFELGGIVGNVTQTIVSNIDQTTFKKIATKLFIIHDRAALWVNINFIIFYSKELYLDSFDFSHFQYRNILRLPENKFVISRFSNIICHSPNLNSVGVLFCYIKSCPL